MSYTKTLFQINPYESVYGLASAKYYLHNYKPNILLTYLMS
jgi:hypothetical protein